MKISEILESKKQSKSLDHLKDEELQEADNPNYFGFGGGSSSAIPGTPETIAFRPKTKKQVRREQQRKASMEKFLGHRK
jgi:hypothetical protein